MPCAPCPLVYAMLTKSTAMNNLEVFFCRVVVASVNASLIIKDRHLYSRTVLREKVKELFSSIAKIWGLLRRLVPSSSDPGSSFPPQNFLQSWTLIALLMPFQGHLAYELLVSRKLEQEDASNESGFKSLFPRQSRGLE